MKQSIFRIQKDRENPYVMVNKQFLSNAELSWKAKGLLTYLLSLPDNWQIYEDEIVKHSKDGKDSLRSALKELIDNGYISRERIRNSAGQLKGYDYYVYETSNHIGKSKDGKPNIGKPATTNNDGTKNESNNNEKKQKGVLPYGENSPLSFWEFAKLYGINEEIQESVEYYLLTYRDHMEKEHPHLKFYQWQEVVEGWFSAYDGDIDESFDIDAEWMQRMINRHFRTLYEKCDYNILHFISPRIKVLRAYEEK